MLLFVFAAAPVFVGAHPASVLLPKKSLAEKIDENPDVVLARPIRLENPQYRITAILKGDGSIEPGQIVEATLSKDPEAPAAIDNLLTSLLLTRKREGDGWVIQSPAGLHLTPFFRKVVALPEGWANYPKLYRERLLFFLPLVAHPDTRIANSAVAAIGRAPYATVRLLKDDLDREKLRAFIADPKQIGWRSLQLSLLGIGGDGEDAKFVRETIDARWEKNEYTDLAALLVAYIELEGTKAADHIVKAYVKDRDRTFIEIQQALTALAMQGDERDPLPREPVIEAFGWVLENRAPLAYLVVPDYMRWKHWDVMPDLAEIARTRGYQLPYIRKRVMTYLEACPLPAAQDHLDNLSTR
ncbi:MAG: hypothetical protein ACR2RV_09010 [Verrucomicrobiales bacterium]